MVIVVSIKTKQKVSKLRRIEDEFLTQGDFFLARWKNGYTFHLANGVEKLFKRKYTEGLNQISATDSMGATRIEDSTNNDYLYLNTDKPEFLHGNVGISPTEMQLYWILPEESGVSFSFPNIDPPSVKNGSDYAMLDGRRSPFEEPSDFTSVTIPSKFHPQIDIYNPYSSARYPKVSLRFAHYMTSVVDFKGKESLIRDLFSPKVDQLKVMIMGSKKNPSHLTKEKQNSWGVKPLPESEFGKILAGGKAKSVKIAGE